MDAGLFLLAISYLFTPTQRLLMNGTDVALFWGAMNMSLAGVQIHYAVAKGDMVVTAESTVRSPDKFFLCAYSRGGYQSIAQLPDTTSDGFASRAVHFMMSRFPELRDHEAADGQIHISDAPLNKDGSGFVFYAPPTV